MNKSIFAVVGSFAIVMLAGCGSSGGGGGSEILVTVNGENISRDQLNKYLSKKPTVRVASQSGVVEANVAEPLDFQALQDMIGQRILTQLAKDENVYPDPASIAKEIEFRKKLEPNFIKQLTANGITMEVIRENIALELARENLLTKGITVTQAEADAYVKNNPAQFTEPAKADMIWVFVKTKTKQATVDNEIRSGQSFQSIASRYSEFTGSENPTRFPQNVVSQMNAELRKIVEATAPGKVTNWLQLSDGYAKFFVQSKTAAKPMVLDSDKKEVIRRTIARGRGEQATDLAKRVLDKIKASQINVTDPTLKEAWKKAYDRLMKENRANTGGTNTPPPTTSGN